MKIDEHKKQFGGNAEDYTKYRKAYDSRLFEFLFSLVTSEPKKILDIACGTGKSTESLVQTNNIVFGCDHDELMIMEARKQAEIKKLNIKYEVADVESLPYPDNEFDFVTVGTAFHWFVNKKSMEEIKRVLKPGGTLFVFWTLTVKDVPEEDSIPWDFLSEYKWDKVPKELRDLDYISNFFNENNLDKVSVNRIPIVNGYNVEEYVGLMKTASAFGILSLEDKESFVERLTTIMKEKLGDRKKFVLEEELQICYGFKK